MCPYDHTLEVPASPRRAGSIERRYPRPGGLILCSCLGRDSGMTEGTLRKSHDVIVVGGGQAGLALGYHLAKQAKDFTILEAASEPAAAWRERWDSLKLFTSARYDGLPGMDFPGDPDRYPTRDEVADYLTEYARRFDLPVELNSRVKAVRRQGEPVCRGARGPHVRGAAGRDRHRPLPDAARATAGPGPWRRGRANAQHRVSVP